MATTRLTDIIVPEVFTPYVQERSTVKTALWMSGIIGADPVVSINGMRGGDTKQVPFWNDLADTEARVGSDDPDVLATHGKIDASKHRCIIQFRNYSWTAMRLVHLLAGDDPMKRIGDLVGGYWDRQNQATLISCLKGIFADNRANDGGDMVLDIAATADGVTPTIGNFMDADAFVEAQQTMGDTGEGLTAIAMHSRVHANLQKQKLLVEGVDPGTSVKFDTFQGKRVVIDDGCPAERENGAGSPIVFTSFMFGAGSVGWSEAAPPDTDATETDRLPASGNGHGQDVLYSRRMFMMHPGGFDWTGASVAGAAPTNAELATASNWNRVLNRKRIPLVAIRSNG